MGNALGFQFQLGERNRDGDQSGELRFFRRSGVGRELLLQLPPTARDRQQAWPERPAEVSDQLADTSSRDHVGTGLRPHDDEVRLVLESAFRKEFSAGQAPPPRCDRRSPGPAADRAAAEAESAASAAAWQAGATSAAMRARSAVSLAATWAGSTWLPPVARAWLATLCAKSASTSDPANGAAIPIAESAGLAMPDADRTRRTRRTRGAG
ncbi:MULTISPECIES: hypothetical protein [Actinomycetes]|uniref:hypothetical protein n=1 Tax=Actinomycetes TaxID=1760 RepID=UPI0001DEE260|nr:MULTISPECIES: hypothetical protein [Actinomycetes]EFL06816.1 predicted protein [Streptomyces sp. AA4]